MNAENKLRELERRAYEFLSREKYAEAFGLFSSAAQDYKSQGRHKQAALCFSSAASCWSKKSGEKTFYKAAVSYEDAAQAAERSGDFEYTSLLYKHAAINHERDREFINFSDCFYRSREAYRKFLTYRLFLPQRISPIIESEEKRGFVGFLKRISSWLVLTLSLIVWGHGERPARTFFSGILVVSLSAFLYYFGPLLENGITFKPNFFEAFYFSIVTFTTLGYGDIAPIGLSRLVAMVEAFSGIFIMPLFLIGLSRKYLRV